ncbi:MAG TPA: hypothetical protein VM659_00355, partial [Dongiaceae bacterium]|nr:hypothetical protein [Dongiaceae bacterium]
ASESPGKLSDAHEMSCREMSFCSSARCCGWSGAASRHVFCYAHLSRRPPDPMMAGALLDRSITFKS